jgi:tether containing UBX domain for GLUT4
MPLTVEKPGSGKKAISATPVTKLAEVFVDACEKFKVQPECHALRYKKKDLDLTLPLRLANLPAGAVTELCELDASEAAKRVVQVSLEREGGSRTQGTFPCTTSLSQLLQKFEDLSGKPLISNCPEGEIPCLTFMNSIKLQGRQAFEASSLLKLGVVSGSVLLKHKFQKVEVAPQSSKDEMQEGTESSNAGVVPGEAMEVEPSRPSAAHTEPGEDTGIDKPVFHMNGVHSQSAVEANDVYIEDTVGGKSTRQAAGRPRTVGRPRPDGGAERKILEVDDDFFELTAADIALLDASKQAKDKGLAFKTRKMREDEKEKRLSAFPTIRIRVVFPNQEWVQAQFEATETIKEVYDFVRESLVHKERPFILQTCPPPQKLAQTTCEKCGGSPHFSRKCEKCGDPMQGPVMLKYTHLLPSAKVYFSWASAPLDGPYLTFELVSEIRRNEQQQQQQQQDGDASGQPAGAENGKAGNGSDGDGEDEKGGAEAFEAFSGSGKFPDGRDGRDGLANSEERNAGAAGATHANAALKRARGGSNQPKWFKMHK